MKTEKSIPNSGISLLRRTKRKYYSTLDGKTLQITRNFGEPSSHFSQIKLRLMQG